jgi:hypothetical protein
MSMSPRDWSGTQMHKITLVCSAHRENGLCNAEELLKILLAIEPEVIFEELRPLEFDFYHRQGSVEAHAITRYREYRLFQYVPVDRYETPKDPLGERREFDLVFDRVIQTSREYRELSQTNDNDRVQQYGFKHLNSVAYATASARMSEIEGETINRAGDQRLIRGLERWRHLIHEREREMVNNIYEYCRKNVFDTGVFLVGAAHKTGIVKEIEEYAGTEAELIGWKFYNGRSP